MYHVSEPILVKNATVRGTHSRFSTEYLGHTQDEDGVTVDVLDRLDGRKLPDRWRYLIGADGGRSQIAQEVVLPFEGKMDIAGVSCLGSRTGERAGPALTCGGLTGAAGECGPQRGQWR